MFLKATFTEDYISMVKMQNLVSLRNTYFGFLLQNEPLIPPAFFPKIFLPSGEKGPVYRQKPKSPLQEGKCKTSYLQNYMPWKVHEMVLDVCKLRC